MANCRLLSSSWPFMIDNSKRWWILKIWKLSEPLILFKSPHLTRKQFEVGRRHIFREFPEYVAIYARLSKNESLRNVTLFSEMITSYYQHLKDNNLHEEYECPIFAMIKSDTIDLKSIDFIFDYPLDFKRLIVQALAKANLKTIKYLISKSKLEELNFVWEVSSYLSSTCQSRLKAPIAYIANNACSPWTRFGTKIYLNWYHWACFNPDVQVMQYLIDLLGEEGINSKDSKGKTVMMYACHYGTKEVVEFVMNRVSYNPSVTDAYMNTMYDYACANKNKMEVIEYLIDLKHDDFDLKALYRYARKHANRGLFEVSRRLRMTQSMQSLNSNMTEYDHESDMVKLLRLYFLFLNLCFICLVVLLTVLRS